MSLLRCVGAPSRRVRQGALVIAVLSSLLVPAVARATPTFTWTQPRAVTTGGVIGITHLACAPASTLCVGGDYFDGDIAASANATGGVNEWITGNIDGRNVNSKGESESTITGVACPSTTLCIATDNSGHILVSTHPTESIAAWTKELPAAPEGHALNSPTCPTTSLCVVADSNGTVLTSTNPGGAGTWTATKLAVTPAVVGCESTTLCIAVSNTGQIVRTTEPTGGEAKWSSPTASVDASHTPTAMACVTGLCAFVDSDGDVVSATEPAGSASKWTMAEVDPGVYLRAITCPLSSLCVVAASYSIAGAVVYYSTNPHGSAGEWTTFAPEHGEFGSNAGVETVACPSAMLCVASLFGGGNNAVLTTTTPTTQTATWAKTELKEPGSFADISCASPALCVALETSTGNIVASTNAAAEASMWTTATVDKTTSLNGLTCAAGSTLCVATDGSGNVYTSTEPAGGASKWTKTAITDAGFLEAVSCPTTAFCAAVDQSGHIITSTTPTVGISWVVSERLSGNPILNKISCPSASFCVATELGGAKVFTSTKPAGGAMEWKATELEGASFMNAIACASATLCVAGDNTDVYATHEPTGGASKWTKEALGWITGASCPSESLCVSSGFFGSLSVASSPTEGVGAWTGSTVDFYERGLNAVSCPTTTFCAAVDNTGDAITGSPSTESHEEHGGEEHHEEIKTTTTTNTGGRTNTGGGTMKIGGGATISTATILARLAPTLTLSGYAATIKALLAKGGISVGFTAPAPGKLAVGWYQVPHGAHLSKAKPVLVAAGTVSATVAGQVVVKIKLTSAGRKLLKHPHRLKLTGKATFTPTGGAPVTTTRTITLKAT